MPDFSITPEQLKKNYKPAISFEEFKKQIESGGLMTRVPRLDVRIPAVLEDVHFLLYATVWHKLALKLDSKRTTIEEILALIEKHWNIPPWETEEG